MAFRKEPAKKPEAAPVPAAPVLKRLRCTQECRYQGVHYLVDDAVSVGDEVAKAMLATGRFDVA